MNLPSMINLETILMNVSNNSLPNYSKKYLVCTHYKKTCHSKSQCYLLIGFPSTFKFTQSKKEDPKSSVQVAIIDSFNAVSQDQYNQLLQLLSQHNISSPSQVNSSIPEGSVHNDCFNFSFSHFVSNDYKFTTFLTPYLSFSIDTNATNHMCSNPNLFLFLNKFYLATFHWTS